jgi:hypothetical protein
MNISTAARSFVSRSDLLPRHAGITSIRYANDWGVVIQRGRLGWWASNDIRWDLIGVQPNGELVQPTLGPFKTFHDAVQAYVKTTRPTVDTRHAKGPSR